MSVKWYLTVVSIYIYLMTNDAEYAFKCLSAIFISSWRNVYLGRLPSFSLVMFLLVSFRSSSYILNINPLSDI